MEKHTHVVVVYPHPDDESIGTGGTILKFREQGVPVTYFCGNLGEMGRNMGSPIFANRETLPKIRIKELEDACEYLDIDFKLLGYRDKTMEYEDMTEMANHLKEELEKIKPSLVITHYPNYGVHPDHNALGMATVEAVRLMDEADRPTVWVSAITLGFEDVLGKPDIVNDVRDVLDEKIEAILKHKSQAEGMIKKIKEQPTEALDDRLRNFEKRMGTEMFYVWDYETM